MSLLPKEKTKPVTELGHLSILIHGRPKAGKSTLASKFPGTLFLATEPGLNHLEVYQIAITKWEQLLEACAELAAGNHSFKTVVIDTVDNAYKFCAEYICAKHKIQHESDLGYGKGYAFITAEFHRVLLKLAQLPYGLVLISHSEDKEIETRTGRIVRTVPTLPNKASKIVLGLVDIIGFIDLEEYQDEEGKKSYRRVLRTKPNLTYEAGDRTGRLPECINLDYESLVSAFNSADKSSKPTSNIKAHSNEKNNKQ